MHKRARNHKHLVGIQEAIKRNHRIKDFEDVKRIQWKKECNDLEFIFDVLIYEPQGKRLN